MTLVGLVLYHQLYSQWPTTPVFTKGEVTQKEAKHTREGATTPRQQPLYTEKAFSVETPEQIQSSTDKYTIPLMDESSSLAT